MEEEWRAVIGWEGLYEVSASGAVRSIERCCDVRTRGGNQARRWFPGVLLRSRKGSNGYRGVGLQRGERKSFAEVHVLVCEAWHGPRRPGTQVAHNDGDKLNCHHTNLRWAKPSENIADKRVHGTQPFGSDCHQAKLTHDDVRSIRASVLSTAELGRQYGMAQGAMWMVKNRKTYRDVI